MDSAFKAIVLALGMVFVWHEVLLPLVDKLNMAEAPCDCEECARRKGANRAK